MKQQEENLSRLLDGDETAALDAAIDEVAGDVNLQYRMRRYQMIGEVMRNELPAAINTGFHADVMTRIREEAGSATETTRADSRPAAAAEPSGLFGWFKPIAGMAVAAGVAVVTVALWQPQQSGTPGAEQLAGNDQQRVEQLVSTPVDGAAVTASARVSGNGMRWTMPNDSDVLQRKLNVYLVNHTEYSNSMQGLIPQARVAGFDAEQ